ncbi:hydrolase [Thelephora ganbajun]|uniref:Hydrolase n=1 Tax=Thelephora ganbajun TaxID=370292 RepID=A0ACB6ZD63_THEGA|nr:hydrolase [Thelephora ganbajun]
MEHVPGAQDASGERHPLLSLISACFWVILWLLKWFKSFIAFVTISIPRLIYSILSYSMTLTLNFWSFAIMFVLAAVAFNYWLRFRYLNAYSEFQEPPLVKSDAQELHPDVNSPDPPTTFHNYLDDFLQAVRVFGFLEKPVFHELARHLQTRRLIAGDSMSLDEDKSFYFVADGVVQVFARAEHQPVANTTGAWDEEDLNGCQLLNEVGAGGTLSSLFKILNLFTEHVQISWASDDSPSEGKNSSSSSTYQSPGPNPTYTRFRSNRTISDVSMLDLDDRGATPMIQSPRPSVRRESVSSSSSTIHPPDAPSPAPSNGLQPRGPSLAARPRAPSRRPSLHRGVVARAKEDTTLAVIPAEAFQRLTKKFPKATAHIVQVILTRFSRVTFSAAHKYLGLTSEVLRTEKAINDIAVHPLPASFYESGGLEKLRQRFDRSPLLDNAGSSEIVDALTSPRPTSQNKAGKKKANGGNMLTEERRRVNSSQPRPNLRPHLSSRKLVQAGDLLSTVGHSSEVFKPGCFVGLTTPRHTRRESMYGSDTDASTNEDILPLDDFNLKEEVMSCIAKSIGLIQPPSVGDEVSESPSLPASDSGGSLFRSPYGSLSLLEMVNDGTSSVTESSSTGEMTGLDNEVEIRFFPAGSTLIHAGERNAGVFYVIEGFLDVILPVADLQRHGGSDTGIPPQEHSMQSKPREEGKYLFTVKPGGIAGYLSSLCNTASYVDIKAKTDTCVGYLPHPALERLLEKRPIVLLTLAKRLTSLLSPLVLHIDASLDWIHVHAGQVLWRPEDVSDSMYIVINGRLRAITESEEGGVNIVAEYGQGDTVGELDVITNTPRRTTLHAIRDSELIRMPQTLFNAISSRNPQITAKLLRMIAFRVREEIDSSAGSKSRKLLTELGRNNTNLKTVAILPVNRHVPVDAFGRKLHTALEAAGASTSYLNQVSVSDHLGKHAFTKVGKLKTAGWLADLEERYRIVLYVADSSVTNSWTHTCIRQADCIMVVGMGDDPSLGEYEKLLQSMKITARKELVLLHPDRSVVPGSTREWLKNRPWIHQHLHVELPGLAPPTRPTQSLQDPVAVAALKNLKDKVQNEIQKYRGTPTARQQRAPHMNDFARLARRLCGKSIGLVLGGGGARGLSHLGFIQALEEYGIPIDHIGGTSIGALVGGLYAREGDLITSSARAKQFSGRMGNIWRLLSDVTYPIVAYTTGHEFNRTIWKAFYDLHIEDMWLPFFCNTTNIITSRMQVHETGYAWRYIRASMTLVGLLPPLCDNGSMLVDGGYIDNLAVSSMFAMGPSAVFACDVGSIDDNSPRNFGDTVSGWWLLINRWNPFSNAKSVPAITEIQSRLAYVSSVNTLEEVKVAKGCLYAQMPVQEYGTLQFNKFEDIRKIGHEEGMKLLEKWDAEGKLPLMTIGVEGVHPKRKGRMLRRNSI